MMNPNLANFAQMAGPPPPPMPPQMPPQMGPQMPPQMQRPPMMPPPMGPQGPMAAGQMPPSGPRRFTPQEMAQQGRFGDSMVAHLTPGEIEVPPQVQTPRVLAVLRQAFQKIGVPPSQFMAGSPAQKVNPSTGAPEFNLLGSILPILGDAVGAVLAPETAGLSIPAGAAIGGAAGGAANGEGLKGIGIGAGLGAASGAAGGVAGAAAAPAIDSATAAAMTPAEAGLDAAALSAVPATTGSAIGSGLGAAGSSAMAPAASAALSSAPTSGMANASALGSGLTSPTLSNGATMPSTAALLNTPSGTTSNGIFMGNATPAPANSSMMGGIGNYVANHPLQVGGLALGGAAMLPSLFRKNNTSALPGSFNTPYQNASQLPPIGSLMGTGTGNGRQASFSNFNPHQVGQYGGYNFYSGQ